jgi:hypothetical protein
MALTDLPNHLIRNATGLVKKVRHLRPGPKKDMDDQTIKAKVESELFRAPGVEKGKLNVTVTDAVVILHGSAKNPAAIRAIEAAVMAVPEVVSVENRLALKNSTARKAPAKPAKPRITGQRFTREVKTAKGEPTPAELAATGAGRQPAPLGSKDTPTPRTGDTGEGSEPAPLSAADVINPPADV